MADYEDHKLPHGKCDSHGHCYWCGRKWHSRHRCPDKPRDLRLHHTGNPARPFGSGDEDCLDEDDLDWEARQDIGL